MRELINQYSKILNETDYVSLRRRLSPELMEECLSHSKTGDVIEESTLNRLMSHIMSHDCAVITSFRNSMVNCLFSGKNDKLINIRTNKGRNKTLKASLLSLGYDITKVKGSYIENYLSDNQIEVKEDSFFVVNSNDDDNFINTIYRLGEMFCQDSVLIIEKGGDSIYLHGTNNSDFPGFGNNVPMGKFKPGIEGEFMTKVGGRPFVIENFKLLSNNSKKIVTDLSRPIIESLK